MSELSIANDRPLQHHLMRLFDRLLACAFVLAIALPLVGTIFSWDFYPRTERRHALAFPSIPDSGTDYSTFSARFLAAFDDNFGFRNTLVHKLQNVRLRADMLTPTTLVIPGKDGWLFVRQHVAAVGFTKERGFEPFTETQLDEWQRLLEARAAFFQSRGMAYVVTIAPEKQAIHPEYLPEGLELRAPSRLDQLAQRLADTHSPVNFVNMQPALRVGARREILYRKTDSHWNFAGAYIGYRELMGEVARVLPRYDLTVQPRSNFEVVSDPERAGDLVAVFGLHEELTEPWDHWIARPELVGSATGEVMADKPRPRLIMFHDSFADNMMPMIMPHFSECLFIDSTNIDVKEFGKQRFDVAISEFVERDLQIGVPTDLLAVTGAGGGQ